MLLDVWMTSTAPMNTEMRAISGMELMTSFSVSTKNCLTDSLHFSGLLKTRLRNSRYLPVSYRKFFIKTLMFVESAPKGTKFRFLFLHLLPNLECVKLLYNIGISLYFLGARIAALFNHKAALFVAGRKGLLRTIQEKMRERGDRQTVWFHCSSVGEFEQARPLIERLRNIEPDMYIVLTFFSPSGYVLRRNYSYADAVFYLPMDTSRNVRRFLDAVSPSTAIFVKYEFWYNYLTMLKERGVRTYIISAIFRPGQIFFHWYGSFMRRVLRSYTTPFVQNEESRRLLAGIGVDNAVIAGDTRFDQVQSIYQHNDIHNEVMEAFISGHRAWVAGSTWDEDEYVISRSLDTVRDAKLILVPHEVHSSHIRRIRSMFSEYSVILYSECAGQDSGVRRSMAESADILVIDSVGMLSKIYKYGSFAYIGGGFSSSGIHNILEAAIYGCPVIFGPHYEKFQEAKDLISLGGAFSISSWEELRPLLEKWLHAPEQLERPSLVCTQYVESHLGASDKIMEHIFKKY